MASIAVSQINGDQLGMTAPASVDPQNAPGTITITYTGQVGAALDSAGGTPTPLYLVPGTGPLTSNGLPPSTITYGAPITWGCSLNAHPAFKYVPANCRY